ncbi:MAG TPA: M23 family metallopeptidase [Solirubrobacterales bacterium]|nr:M23 family metallopeptidase [Solirubrobacterales bacterium]
MARRAAACAGALAAGILIWSLPGSAAGAELRLESLPAHAPFAAKAAQFKSADVSPGRAFFDAKRKPALRFRALAPVPDRVRTRVVRADGGKVVRHWVETGVEAGRLQERSWDGRRANGKVVADGRYRFELGAPGSRLRRAGDFRFYDHRFPVRGPHFYGDRFGVPRSGGRTHEGQDVVASCGTPLGAARGGRVQARGYSHSLYGFWVLIDGRKTSRDYFYSHLQAASPLRDGERVRTGARVGLVGKTGNARSEFCQLHFELWPRGYRHGAPKDPLPALRDWDGWS